MLLVKGRKFNVHKTFRRCPERLLSVLCTFNLRPVFRGILKRLEFELIMRISQKLIVNSDPTVIFT